MPQRLNQLVRYFVEHIPGAGRTQIVKFLYLADLESRRYLGKPLSDLTYRWDEHGPFDRRILDSLNHLRKVGFIEEEHVSFPNGTHGYCYTSTGRAMEGDWTEPELAILNHVVSEYGRLPLRDLLEDVVYETEPMRDARKRKAHGQLLKMKLVDNQARIAGLELERTWKSWEQAERGQIRPLDEVMDELPRSHHGRGR